MTSSPAWTAHIRKVLLTSLVFLVAVYLYLSFGSDRVDFSVQDTTWNDALNGAGRTSYRNSALREVGNLTFHTNDYSINSATCDALFPHLFEPLDHAVEVRKQRKNVSATDLDLEWKSTGAVRAMIWDRRLYVIESKFDKGGYDIRRAIAILSQINRAIIAAPMDQDIPDIEFTFSVSDIADKTHTGRTIWTLTKLDEEGDELQWLMPDFGFWSWPLDQLIGEYEDVRRKIHDVEHNLDFEAKIPKAFWRGAELNKVRTALLQQTAGKPWADVKAISWAGRAKVKNSSAKDVVPMWDACRYKYLIHTEGASYSGRGKYLQNCESVPIMHKLQWTEHYHHLLVSEGPDQNVVLVERDFSDLGSQINFLEQNPDVAKRIAANNVRDLRELHLTPAAQACYWRRMFHAWASVSFQPNPYDASGVWRGVPYESYILHALKDKCASFWKMLRLC